MKIGFSENYIGPGGARSWIRHFGNYCLSKGHQVIYGYDPTVDVFCSVSDLSKPEELAALRARNINVLQRLGSLFLPYNHPDQNLINLRNQTFKELIVQSNKVVYQSVFTKAVLYRWLYNGKEPDGEIIYNSTNPSLFTETGKTIPKPAGKKIILASAYWGTPHTAARSIQILIQVMKLFERRKDIEFWVLGRAYPPDEEAMRRAQLTNLGKLNLHDPIPYETMPYYLRTVDLVLHLKVHEGCSNMVIETMNVGTPIVGINSGSLPELVGDAALLANCSKGICDYPQVDVQDLANKILLTLENPNFYKKLLMARAKCFPAKAMNERYLQILEQLAKK